MNHTEPHSRPAASRCPASSPAHGPASGGVVWRIGCVSYINAKPLIDGLETPRQADDPVVRFDVPSRLLEDLETGQVDVALCPVIDYFRSRQPLTIVPAGGIGCHARTLTVRLFSRLPLERITELYADTDSHTSVALVQILLFAIHGIRPRMIDYHAREQVAGHRLIDQPDAMLLIGDKVVTNCPPQSAYPHQMDLGEAWRQLTGLPFLFAVWMARQDTDLGTLPRLLERQRVNNAHRVGDIAARYAPAHGWPVELATRYLRDLLYYPVGPQQLEAISQFAARAFELKLIDTLKPLHVHRAIR